MRKIYPVILILPALMTGACKKEIDFEYTDIDPILVIEGALTMEGAEVALTFTTPMDEPMDRRHVTDAEVTIEDLASGATIALTAYADGVFRAAEGGVPGHGYRLTVERTEGVYAAECVMGGEVEIVGMEFGWIKMPYDDVAVLQVSWLDDSSVADECYWLRLYRNGEAYRWAEVNDLLSDNGVINEVMMTSRRDLDEEDEADRLEAGDVVTATVAPVSRRMHDYLEALAQGNSNGPRLFTGPLCLGYFLAAPVSTRTVTFDPDSMLRYD